MKSTKRFVIFLLIGLIVNLVRANHQLDHICAYSNESVVKFRDKLLQSKQLMQTKYSGIQFDWPIDLCQFWISSLYGLRNDPSGLKRMHHGVDMAATNGTEVKSAGDGVIVTINQGMPGYGNVIDVEHKGKFMTRYAHLKQIKTKLGQRVKQGQIIGTVGATGNVRGHDPSHLHFELSQNGKRVDPLKYLYAAEINYKK